MSDFDQPLKPALLLKRCNPADFDFSTTETLPDIGLAIGQERAMEALQFGLSTTQEGFTLFALGPPDWAKPLPWRLFWPKSRAIASRPKPSKRM